VPSTNTDSNAYPANAWLAGLLPVDARRFRVSNPALAETLRAAGAQLVEREADVEIAPAREVSGEAPVAIVNIDAAGGGSRRIVRVARRLVNSIRVRSAARRAHSMIQTRGYPTAVTIRWDVLQPLRLPWLVDEKRSRRLVERLPQRALVLGLKSGRSRTLLEAAAADASSAAGIPVVLRPPLVRAEVLVMVAADAVLRVAVGPSREEIDRQVAALETLHAADVPASVTDRVPTVLARGNSGLADWSLERRLPGATPSRDLPDALLRECVDFLVDLHSVRGPGVDGTSCASLAEVLAELCAPEHVAALRDLGSRLDSALADLPRGFGHADFGRGNLLVEGDRLVGVIDWDGAGPARLPLLGLLHLRLGAAYDPQDDEWGQIVVTRLLPWADSGGDEIVGDYCRRLGFEPHPERLRALALAFWLDLITLHLRLHPFRRDDSRWIGHNIDAVIRLLGTEV